MFPGLKRSGNYIQMFTQTNLVWSWLRKGSLTSDTAVWWLNVYKQAQNSRNASNYNEQVFTRPQLQSPMIHSCWAFFKGQRSCQSADRGQYMLIRWSDRMNLCDSLTVNGCGWVYGHLQQHCKSLFLWIAHIGTKRILMKGQWRAVRIMTGFPASCNKQRLPR